MNPILATLLIPFLGTALGGIFRISHEARYAGIDTKSAAPVNLNPNRSFKIVGLEFLKRLPRIPDKPVRRDEFSVHHIFIF